MEIPEVTITCCNTDCGISFAVPQWWHRGKRDNHSWFYCPNGHHQHFTAETDEEKLRRERDRLKQQVARAEDEAREATMRAERAEAMRNRIERAKKRLEKRTAAGTCPCCQRTFSNMSTHMRKQHPTFVAEAVEAPKLKVVK